MKPKGDRRSAFEDQDAERVAPYSALCHLYDRIMTHVDYEYWAGFLLQLMADHGLKSSSGAPAPSILDCGCGTGSFAVRLAGAGYNVEGFDPSPGMIEAARRKAAVLSPPPRFRVSDFLALADRGRFDAVICCYDSLNYLMRLEDVTDFFRRVRIAMRPGGVFVVDICTVSNSRRFFSRRRETGEAEGYRFERIMRFDERRRIQMNDFTITFTSEGGKIFREHHRQRIYTVAEIMKAIRAAGLRLLESTSDFERKPPRRDSLRVHFVCDSGSR